MNTFGVVAAGAVLVLLNQRKSWDELSYELGLVEPDAILTDGDDYGFNDQLRGCLAISSAPWMASGAMSLRS